MDTVVISTISAIVAIVGCCVGVAGWTRNARKDGSEIAASIAAIQTAIGYIENDIKEIKAEFRRIEDDVQDARETAGKALSTAEAAHDRLDALGAHTASQSRKEIRGGN